jgi:hypothetical protein
MLLLTLDLEKLSFSTLLSDLEASLQCLHNIPEYKALVTTHPHLATVFDKFEGCISGSIITATFSIRMFM